MGWYFSHQSRSELIAELTAPQETERASAKVIAHTLRGTGQQGRGIAAKIRGLGAGGFCKLSVRYR